ncbi:AAA family ATPase [Nonomuraea sp. B19D2]|uniref:AAA family ATPase n=1 Tax=Nonomuraea sp. B19D2 TaxID=3159561 RepID=UPI0032DB3C7F
MARQVASGALKLTPAGLLATLSSAALIPLALTGPAGVALAGLGVLGGVGANILSDVVYDSIQRLRQRTAGEPSPDEVESELAEHLERLLTSGTREAGELREILADLLGRVDAVAVAVDVAGDRDLKTRLTEAFSDLGSEFTEFHFVLAGVATKVDELMESVNRQQSEQRGDRDRLREQSLLLRQIQGRLLRLAPDPAVPARWLRGSPYRGLLPFEDGDQEIFYGREEDTFRVAQTIAERLHGPSLVLVTGASGAGKSSLLRAGLLPGVRRGLLGGHGSVRWPARLITPTADPVGELARLLAAFDASSDTALSAALRADPEQAAQAAVRHVVRASGAPPGARLVLVVDQFEEVFTLAGADRRETFVAALAAMAHSGAAAVVLGLRADFLTRCAEHDPLAEAMENGQFVLRPMTRERLGAAITGPAAAAGLELEPQLTEYVLDEIGARSEAGAGALPLLSQAMLAAYENREGNHVTVRGYEQGGGIEGAVRKSADDVYAGLTEAGQATTRRLFRRLTMITADGLLARRPIARAELVGDAGIDDILERFGDRRLLVLTEDHVEIAHDCLFDAWPLLRSWLEDDRVDLRLLDRLQREAEEWKAKAKDPGLLYRGLRLEEIRRARPSWVDSISDTAAEFLRASERAQSRRRRLVVGAVATVSLLAFIASIAAVIAVRTAEQNDTARLEALSRQLSAQSVAAAENDISLAGRLATAAVRVADTAEARHALVNVLAYPTRSVIENLPRPVTTVVSSGDGALLAILDEDAIRVLDARTHAVLATIPATRQAGVGAVAFQPGRHALAVLDGQGEVRLCQVPAVTCRKIMKVRAEVGHEMVFSRDGGTLAVGGDGKDGKTVRLWHAANDKTSTIETTETYNVEHLAFHPDGQILATSSYEGWDISFWNVQTGKRARDPIAHGAYVTAMAYSPDGKTLATTATQADTYVRLWDPETGKLRAPPLAGHTGVPHTLAFSPDGRLLATGAAEVLVWDVAGRRAIGGPLPAAEGATSMAFGLDGRTLAVTDGGRRISLWGLSSARLTGDPTVREDGYLDGVQFSPDGQTIATWGDDGSAYLRFRRTATFQLTGPASATTGVESFRFTPEGPITLSGGTLRIPGRSGTVEHQLDTAHGSDRRAALSEDGRTLVTVTSSGPSDPGPSAVELWRLDRGVRRLWRADLPLYVQAVALSSDGRRIAASGENGEIWLWNTASGTPGKPLSDRVLAPALAFSHDGTKLAAAGQDKALWLWDVVGRTVLKGPLTSQANGLTAVAFSPDGTMLATGSRDRTVRLWDVATGRTVGPPLTGHDSEITALAFAPDGAELVSVGNTAGDQAAKIRGSEVRRWDVPVADDPRATVCSIIGESLPPAEWARYVIGVRYARACP